MFEWQEALTADENARARIFTGHLAGSHIDLLSRLQFDWTVNWLLERKIKAWIIDPLGEMLAHENDNDEVRQWFRALKEIAKIAEISVVFVPRHTGHAGQGEGDSMPRGRGASVTYGTVGASFTYRHGGNLGDSPPDDRRYLSGFGRGVDLRPEITLDYEPATGRLFRVDSAGRKGDQIMRLAYKAADAVAMHSGPINSTKLKRAMGGRPASALEGIGMAVDDGLITETVGGPGKPTLYESGPAYGVKPYVSH
jgi:hypothetical protein